MTIDFAPIEVEASLSPRPTETLARRPLDIMYELLRNGHQDIFLSGALIDDFTNGVHLMVEDDAQHLLEDYEYVEALAKEKDVAEFDTYLGEGSLVFTTKWDGPDTVYLAFVHRPNSDPTNDRRFNVTLPRTNYLSWWRSIAAALLRPATSAGADDP